MRFRKILLKILLILIAVVLVAAGGFIAFLTVTEYRPGEVETLEVKTVNGRGGDKALSPGETISLISFNIGYGALGEESDFFMDGGSQVRPEEEYIVAKNMEGIREILSGSGADIYLLQEVDSGSKRSYNRDLTSQFRLDFGRSSAYAINYKCTYVPYPIPTIGGVESGLMTFSDFEIGSAARHRLPTPFSWPVRVAQLKRCLLVSRIPLEGTYKELVVVNLHLEAYDDGEGKAAQFKVLTDLLESEYAKGNYVIAGGDFNCYLPTADNEKYPLIDDKSYVPGVIEEDAIPEGWSVAVDDSHPTCRLLNKSYDPEARDNQYYVIDGYILSPNVELNSVQTMDSGFKFSDHSPVLLKATLAPSRDV